MQKILSRLKNRKRRRLRRLAIKGIAVVLALVLSGISASSQNRTSILQGHVTDELGGVIAGATVTVTDTNDTEKTVRTSEQGFYIISGLAPGLLLVRVKARGFALYENTEVQIPAGRREILDISLRLMITETLDVKSEAELDMDSDNNGNQIVLKGSLLDALPDDPDSLLSALTAIVGASSGPNGIQTTVDGFRGGRVPPKDFIREIRINRNPFSAEYDRPGFNRVEIFTKPGTEKIHGEAFINFSDNHFNARNPFAFDQTPFQSRLYGLSFSGSPIKKKLSMFMNLERREINDNVIISATTVDEAFNAAPFREAVKTPQYFTSISPRFDYSLNANSAMSLRYVYTRASNDRAGLTPFSLPSSAYDISSTEHILEFSYLKAFSGKSFNDAKFQFVRNRKRYDGDNSSPALTVLEAFTGGGAQVGSSRNDEDRWELVNNFSWSVKSHAFRIGGRLRGVHITDVSPFNFGGTFVFAGGIAPILDANNHPVRDASGQTAVSPVTSIERYRRTILFQSLGLDPATIRELGGGAAQFSVAAGDPRANVNQLDFGGFFLDEWRIRPNMTLSYGLRYETQTNLNANLDLGPRLGFIWNPGAGKDGRSKTLVRIGMGLFYDRFSEILTMQARRFNGAIQKQFIASERTASGRSILDHFPNLPLIAALETSTEAQTIRRIDKNLQSPYTILTGISIERELPFKVILTTNYANRRRVHDLRSRNINAPDQNGMRPFKDAGNIFEFESDAIFKQHQVTVSLRYASSKCSLFGSYIWSKSNSDSDGPFTFPANPYDLSLEYGRTAQDIRHNFSLAGNFNLPWNLSFSPLITARSGIPFNITTGKDTNGDGVFTERPAFASSLNNSDARSTGFGWLDPNPSPGQRIIPRNFGSGPGFFQISLRLSKVISFGRAAAPATASGNRKEEKRFKLTLALQAYNLTNHTNYGPVIGNISSPLFGQSNSIYGGFGFGASSNPSYNRRVEAQVRYSF